MQLKFWQKKTAKKIVKKDDAKRMDYPNPRGYKRMGCGTNKKGQAMMIGILILVMALIIFVATLPAIQETMDVSRGCDYLNCVGYVDQDATAATSCDAQNQSYNSGGNKNTLSCTIMDLAIPFLILAVLAGLVMKLIHGKMVDPQESQFAVPGY